MYQSTPQDLFFAAMIMSPEFREKTYSEQRSLATEAAVWLLIWQRLYPEDQSWSGPHGLGRLQQPAPHDMLLDACKMRDPHYGRLGFAERQSLRGDAQGWLEAWRLTAIATTEAAGFAPRPSEWPWGAEPLPSAPVARLVPRAGKVERPALARPLPREGLGVGLWIRVKLTRLWVRYVTWRLAGQEDGK